MAYSGPIWEGIYSSFSEVPVVGAGFDSEIWIENSLRKIATLQEEVARNVSLPPSSNYREALLPLLASVVYNEQQELRILDFGGGIGLTYFQTIYGLPRTAKVNYHIVERESACQVGKEYFGSRYKGLFFESKIPPADLNFDIVYSGSALQYIDDWKGLIAQFCTLSRKYLLLVDVLAGHIPTFVSAQHFYRSKIATRFLNIDELLLWIDSLGYEFIHSSVFTPVILGKEQYLPMQNFDEKYRLNRACNLLFERHTK